MDGSFRQPEQGREPDPKGGSKRRARSVLIVGGGVVGLSCAWFLQSDGHEVTVLERGTVGGGATRGNAGLVCPSLADPLPAPGVLRHALGGLLRPDSPLFVHPRALPRMGEFLVRFAAATSPRMYGRGLRALALLDQLTFGLFDDLVEAGAIGGAMGDRGYVMGFKSRSAAEEAHRVHRALGGAGIGSPPGPLLAGSDLVELEPALSDRARFGFLQPNERWVDPSRMIDALAASLRSRGVTIREGTAAVALEPAGIGATVRTADGASHAEAVVVAAGAWSGQLVRALGVRLGIKPGKGYSFFVDPEEPPQRPVYLADAHVVATPIGGRLRIAGTMEFDGSFDRMNRRRIEAMVSAAQPWLRGVDWAQRTDEWVAPRPMTPDGLPLIGALPGHPGLFVASGHNMLGLTLAPSTGRVIADLVTSGETSVDIAPFSPARFAWRSPRS